MTDDLVKRLRWLGDHASFDPHMHHIAADRIEEQSEEIIQLNNDIEYVMNRNKALEAALRDIAAIDTKYFDVNACIAHARAALAGEKKDG